MRWLSPFMRLLTGGTKESFLWTEAQEKAFKTIKETLLKAHNLAIPNIHNPFQLFMDELTQQLTQDNKGCHNPTAWTLEEA